MKSPVPALRRLVHLAWRRRLRSSLEKPDACSMFDVDLVVAPGVLHPLHFASSRLMASHIRRLDLRGLRVADLGAGSGILAILAARAGGDVTAIDISPAAVACASANIDRNDCRGQVTVVRSDVFAALSPGLRFDLVVANPPFFPRDPKDENDVPFAAGPGHAFTTRLAQELPRRLTAKGRLLAVDSSDSDFRPVGEILARAGFSSRVVERKRGVFETLTIREFREA